MRLPTVVRWLAATPRRNALAGLAALVAAVGLFGLVGRTVSTVGAVGELLVLAATSTLVLAGAVLLAQPARLGIGRALAVGVGVYLLAGLVVFATGIPVYNIAPGTGLLLVAWPMYLIWLHPCLLGGGLWVCPSG